MDSNGRVSTVAAAKKTTPPIGLREAGIHFRLLLAGDADRPAPPEEPFVRLSPGESSHRCYLARIFAGEVQVGGEVSLLLEPISHGIPPAGAANPMSSNSHFERVWAAGLEAMRRVGAAGTGPLEGFGFVGDGEDLLPPTQGPLAYCQNVDAYLEPVCPGCLGPLKTCKDEALLRTSGLPSYRVTSAKFLYCPACAAQSRPGRTFYCYDHRKIETLADGIRLRRRSELYRDLSPRINGAEAEPPAHHPCFTCEHRTSCYPPGSDLKSPIEAERFLVPVSYYEFFYLPIEPLPFDFAETSALLGGASPDDLPNLQRPAEEPESVPLEARTRAALSPPNEQFFFQGDPTGLFGLEVLHLKLVGFTSVVRGIRDLAARAGRPHLALDPSRVRSRLGDAPGHVPARWTLISKVRDFVSTAPLFGSEGDRVEGEPTVWAVPEPKAQAFLPREVMRSQIQTLWGRLDIKSLEVKTEGQGDIARLTGRVAIEHWVEADHGRHDLVRIALQSPVAGTGRFVFAGGKTATHTGGFDFSGFTNPLSADEAQGLRSARSLTSVTAEVTTLRTFSTPTDVVSLGVLLLRFLLFNNEEDGGTIDRNVIENVAAKLSAERPEPESEGSNGLPRWPRIRAAFQEQGVDVEPKSILYRAEDRQIEPAIPETLWSETLLLALRMGSNLPGWSLCETLEDYPVEEPAAPLERVLLELGGLCEQARGSLVGSGGRNSSVLRVCADFLADLQEAASEKDLGQTEQPGDRTVVISRGHRP
jgi:hypothetical protein